MTRLTRAAVCLRLASLALAPLCTLAFAAGADGVSRYVIAPADPTLAPADPRDALEPRDMTNPRMTRRALRSRSRDRVAPEMPLPSQPPRDLTVAPARPGLGRRLESLWTTDAEDDWIPSQKRATARTAPPAPVATPRPITPEETVPVQVEIEASAPQASPTAPDAPDIRLTQAHATNSDTDSAPPAADPLTDVAESPLATQVRPLDKPIQQIGLVEPIDSDGLRPVDVAATLSPSTPPRVLTGSYFGVAHPARYVYCFTHNPLYFEDANLERCGIGHGFCQPACSAAQFLGRTALLPWSLIANPPCSCETTLGDCPTCHAYPWGTEIHR